MDYMKYISQYYKARIRDMWNADVAPLEISAQTGIPLDVLINWIQHQPGYPDLLKGKPGRPVGYRLSREPRKVRLNAQPY